MKITTLIIAAAAATTLAGAASAQQIPSDAERKEMFQKADENKDGKLDKAEYTKMLPAEAAGFADQLFAARDANKDGFVSAEESAAPMNFGG